MSKTLQFHLESGRLNVTGSPDADERKGTVEAGRGANLDLAVSDECRVEVHADRLELCVENVAGLEAHIDSGTIEALDIDGLVDIHADRADISVENVEGNVEISCDSGDIEVLRVRGRVEINADSGDITVQATSDRVEIEVDSGDVVVDLVPFGHRPRYTVTSDSGAVTVRIAGDVGVRAKLESDSGDILNDTVDGDDVLLEITTDSGDITVLSGVPALG